MPLPAPVDLNTQPMSEEDLERFSRLARLTSGLNAPAAPAPQYVQPMPAGQSSAGMARLVSQLQPKLGDVSPATAVESRRSVLLPRNSPTNAGFTLTKNVYRMKPRVQASSSTGQESYPGESADTTPEPVAAGRNPAAVARMASGAPRYVGQGATQLNPEPPSPLAIAGAAARRGAQGEPGVPPPPPKPVYGPSGQSFQTTGEQRLEHQAEYASDLAAHPPNINDPKYKHHGLRRAFDIIGGVAQGALALNPMVGVDTYRNLAHSDYNNATKDYNARLDAAKQAEGAAKDYAEEQEKQTTGEARLQQLQNQSQYEQARLQMEADKNDIARMLAEGKLDDAEKALALQAQRIQDMQHFHEGELANANARTQQAQWMDLQKDALQKQALELRDKQIAQANDQFQQKIAQAKSKQEQQSLENERKSRINDIENQFKMHPWLSGLGLYGNKTQKEADVNRDINARIVESGGTPAAPPPQAATAAQVHAYAIEHKITDDRARQVFQQAGIKVGK